jgi:hypothetical protein
MELKPRHHSVLKRKTPQKPGLAVMTLPDETRVMIEAECLDIFTRMSNSGMSLHQTLTAIFLSGMSAAKEAME